MSTPKRTAARHARKTRLRQKRSEWYSVNVTTAQVEPMDDVDTLSIEETLSLTTPAADRFGDTAELRKPGGGPAYEDSVTEGDQEDLTTMELPQQPGAERE